MIIKYPKLFPDDPALKLEFETLDTSDTPNIEFHIDPRKDFVRENNKKYICLNLELPNSFALVDGRNDNILYYEKLYDKILTICPYTVKIRNKVLGKELYQYCYFPSPSSWNRENDKEFDIIYTGSGSEFIIPNGFEKYNYKVVNQHPCKYLTDMNVDFSSKLDLISKSKITIVHNILNLNKCDLNFDTHNYFEYRSEKLGFPIQTQHKSRVIEAARCKSLLLCKEDDFNLIEDLFVENEDFIYFNDENFNEKVDHILENYDDYQFMIENAFNKIETKYNIKNFYNDLIR